MKKNVLLFSLGAAALFGITIISGCSDSSGSDNTLQPIELSRAEAEVCADLNDFSVNLLKAVVENSEGKNVAVSPLGAAMVAGMFGNAIAVEDRAELANALGIDANDFDVLNSYCAKMLATLPNHDKSAKVILANGSWFNQSISQLNDSYREILENDYSSEIKICDFSDNYTLSDINNWVAERTDNEIPEIIDELTPLDCGVWINALYFKGLWQYRFDESKTKNAEFILTDGTKTEVKMMTADDRVTSRNFYKFLNGYYGSVLPGADDENILTTAVATMNYGNSGYAFTAIMPDYRVSIADFISEYSNILFKISPDVKLMDGGDKTDLFFPKFNLEVSTDLIPLMQSLGVNALFDRQECVNMPGIGLNKKDGFIGEYKQSIRMGVDENGAKVKAATVAKGLVGASIPRTSRFNHPFIYFIKENSTGTIILAGVVMNPNE